MGPGYPAPPVEEPRPYPGVQCANDPASPAGETDSHNRQRHQPPYTPRRPTAWPSVLPLIFRPPAAEYGFRAPPWPGIPALETLPAMRAADPEDVCGHPPDA